MYGLVITTDQGSVVGWAVQKSTLSGWFHRRTRADDIAAEIMDRAERRRRRHRPRPRWSRPRDDAAVSPAPLLLLTGSPGSGKTTVAPLVADRHEPSACLDLDWFFAKLRRGAMEPWREEAHTQNRVVLQAAAGAVATFASGGYFTVAEGILYPFMLDLFAAAAAGGERARRHDPLRGVARAHRRGATTRPGPAHRARTRRRAGRFGRRRRPLDAVRAAGRGRTPPGGFGYWWTRRGGRGDRPPAGGRRPGPRDVDRGLSSRRRRGAAWWCGAPGPCRSPSARTCRRSP